MRHQRRPAVLALILLTGCTSQLSARVPTVSGGPTYQADLDTCERTTPAGIEARGERFAGCMIAAGHAAWVEVATGEEFLIRQTRPHERQAAENDVAGCYRRSKNASSLGDCLAPLGYAIQRWEPSRR
jgi:hypothetical protein